MKKAKMMLLGIAILGTVGAALAFKAKAFTRPDVYICTTTVGNTIGTCEVAEFASTSGTPTTYPKSLAWVATTTLTCIASQQTSSACGTVHPTTLFVNP